MTNEQIFLETLKDIRYRIKDTFSTEQKDKIHPNKGYDLIRACGLLRQLLIDDSPLMLQVNKNYKLKIVFTTIDIESFLLNEYDGFWVSLTPTKGIGSLKEHKLVDFLKLTTMGEFQYRFSVLEIIKTCSHVVGGIHSREPFTEKEKLFVRIINKNGDSNEIYTKMKNKADQFGGLLFFIYIWSVI